MIDRIGNTNIKKRQQSLFVGSKAGAKQTKKCPLSPYVAYLHTDGKDEELIRSKRRWFDWVLKRRQTIFENKSSDIQVFATVRRKKRQ